MTAVQDEVTDTEIKVSEEDILDPVPATYTLVDGTVVSIEDLKTRQFFRLFRIITHGAPAYMEDGITSLFDGEGEEIVGRLLAMVVFSIPEAEQETIDFLVSMVKPVGLTEGNSLSKQAIERNRSLWDDVDKALANPELEDTFGIVELIIRREAKNLAALGKRLLSRLELALKTGQDKPSVSSKTSKASTQKA